MSKLEEVILRYLDLGINQQIDYEKYYLYSIITHSTAIEGSTVTELENQLLFDEGITAKGKTLAEQQMNVDLKAAYEESLALVRKHSEISVDMLRHLAAIVMKGTGKTYRTALGDFSSANGDLRLLNVAAGVGGRSYMSFNKVPQKLNEFCQSLNESRRQASNLSVQQRYDVSFDAHFRLVTIHPWADGNGRISRLLMNHLQFEFGLIPTKILREDKEEYIKALIEAREQDDLQVFRDFMSDMMVKNLNSEIALYLQSTEETVGEYSISREKKPKSREKILELLAENPKLTIAGLSATIGIGAKAVEKQLAKLRADGRLRRVGPAKGGHWELN